MFIKRYFTGLFLALVLVLGWTWLGGDTVKHWFKPEPPSKPAIRFDNDDPPAAGLAQNPTDAAPAQQVIRKATSGIHKCKVNGSVIYTDAPCENPGHEQNIGAGSVTVVKGQRAAAATSAGTASLPNARDLLGRHDPNDHTLLDKHIDNQTR